MGEFASGHRAVEEGLPRASRSRRAGLALGDGAQLGDGDVAGRWVVSGPTTEFSGSSRPPQVAGVGGREFQGAAADERGDQEGALGRSPLGRPALVVGLSLGGYESPALAARHPDQVAGVDAPGCGARPRGPLAFAYRGAGRLASWNPERVDRLTAGAFARTMPPQVARALVAGGVSCEVVPQVVREALVRDPAGLPSRVPGPVWLVNGTWDPFGTDGARFLAACRNGWSIAWPRSGPPGPLAQPGRLPQLVRDAATVVSSDTGGWARGWVTRRPGRPPRVVLPTGPGDGWVGGIKRRRMSHPVALSRHIGEVPPHLEGAST